MTEVCECFGCSAVREGVIDLAEVDRLEHAEQVTRKQRPFIIVNDTIHLQEITNEV